MPQRHQADEDTLRHALCGQRLDLALHLLPLGDGVGDDVEGLAQVAAGLAQREDGFDCDVHVFEGNPLAESTQRVVGETAEVDLLDHAAELVGDRRLDFPDDELHRLLQTQAGLETVRHQKQRVDELIVDGVEPLVAHVEHDAPRPEIPRQTENSHRDGTPEQAIAEEQTNQHSAEGRAR